MSSAPSFRSLEKSLHEYLDGMNVCDELLTEGIRYDIDWMKVQGASCYLSHVRAVESTFRQIKRRVSSPRSNPSGVPIEILERIFLHLKNETGRLEAKAKKLEVQGAKGRRDARSAANRLREITRQAAQVLSDELKRKELWSTKLAKELGIYPWLR